MADGKVFTLLFSAILIVVVPPTSPRIRKPRAELKAEFRTLYDSGTALRDFVFLEIDDLKNYTETNGSPRNRTRLVRKKKLPKKARSIAENTIGRAMNNLERKKHKELITSWAILLHNSLYSEILDNTTKKALQRRLVSLSTTSQRLVNRTMKRNKRLKARKEKSVLIDLEKDFKEVDGEELEDIMKILNEDISSNGDDYVVAEDIAKELSDEEEPISKREQRYKRDIQDAPMSIAADPRSRRIVQPIDLKRMRRSASFSYSTTPVCTEAGSAGDTNGAVQLCHTCEATVDFGSTIMPQFANSIECADSHPDCLSGDGTCTQKVVYYTMHYLADAATNDWQPFDQPLNVSCECECENDSWTYNYRVKVSS